VLLSVYASVMVGTEDELWACTVMNVVGLTNAAAVTAMHCRVRMMSDRLSDLSSVLQNIRPHIGAQTSPVAPRYGATPPSNLPQAIQLMRNVQTSLDWVLNKQVCCSCFSISFLYLYCASEVTTLRRYTNMFIIIIIIIIIIIY